jgi:AbrB family looped-hinge helix DNA binding protein
MKEIVSSITSKGQITIPVEVRRHLGVGTTDKVSFVIEDDGKVELRPTRYTVASLRGIVPPLPGRETIDFEDQIEEALEARVDDIVRRLERR